jgi:GT2 family glycosyltransferase
VKITVLVPTYRRPAYLIKCLRALESQIRQPDHVIVVTRDTDLETQETLQCCSFKLDLDVVTIHTPGQVAALNAGLTRVVGDILAITDDDAVPHLDWLQRIEAHFVRDPTLGGVGGRDYLRDGHVYRDSAVVGKIEWYGRHIGNHHCGVGVPRYVDLLKGANMSYRVGAIAALQFDTRLLGAGAQLHNDMSFSLRLKRRGWHLLYDPAVAVDHFSAERFDEDERFSRSAAAIFNEAHNETIAILEHLPSNRWPLFLGWAVLVGHRSLPGALQCLRLALMGYSRWKALPPVIMGRCLGLKTLVRNAQG